MSWANLSSVVKATRVEYEIQYSNKGAQYRPVGPESVTLSIGRRDYDVAEWFQSHHPTILFERAAFSRDNQFYRVQYSGAALDAGRIEAWDWAGTDIRKESQTTVRFQDSIQHRVIKTLMSSNTGPAYSVIFDDDDANEVADVVALAIENGCLLVHLFHCKFSGDPTPGARITDLYEVCGQAQKSVHWKGDVDRLVTRLLLREAARKKRSSVSRFCCGNVATLNAIAVQLDQLKIALKIFIVQPGLSRSAASPQQRELLAATELYLKETYMADFAVVGSA